MPPAATGLVYPVWAILAMAASVTASVQNSMGTRPALLFEATGSVKARRAREGQDQH